MSLVEPSTSSPVDEDSEQPTSPAASKKVMKKRFAAARDAEEKRAILAEVQRKFGNEKAAELVREASRKDDDLPAKLAKHEPEKKKK